MSQARKNKLYRVFTRGLITEASPLTYPEDSSFDELNTVFTRKGNRRRRYGFNYNSSNVFAWTYDAQTPKVEYIWVSVAQNDGLNYLVSQDGQFVRFFDQSVIGFPQSLKYFTIDLNQYLRPGAIEARYTPVSFASGKGYLFIVSEMIEPLIVSYDIATDAITVTKIAILARDFEGLRDGLQNDEEPLTLTAAHHYNLQNQGWVPLKSSQTSSTPVQSLNGYVYNSAVRGYIIDGTYVNSTAYQGTYDSGPIAIFKNKLGRYPGNNKQWWLARADADDKDKGIKAGDFLPDILETLYSGNNLAPRGHYILNQFRKDRAAVSGVSGLPVEELNTRPSAVTFFSGRAWFAADSTLYYSQILDSTSADKAGLCYQEADPTAEDISDLIASDGGVIPIPESVNIQKLVPVANGVMVFARNGVWFVSGGDASFSALNISTSKVSPIGTVSPRAIVEIDDTVFWWSDVGIQALQQSSGQYGPIAGKFGNTNIAESTIQTFYNGIKGPARSSAKVVYDSSNNLIIWLYRDTDVGVNEYNNILTYDVTLQAFYPWKISSIENGPRVTGLFVSPESTGTAFQENVVVGPDVVTASGVPVTIGRSLYTNSPGAIFYITNVPGQGQTVSAPVSMNYVDWETYDSVGVTYDSYVLTGFELNDDAMRDKQIIYFFAYFNRNSDAYPGSCVMSARWDWSGNHNPNKWSNSVELYRIRPRQDNEVVVSKNKVRGNGKSVQFRLGTSERGKSFDLLGWSIGFSGVTES